MRGVAAWPVLAALLLPPAAVAATAADGQQAFSAGRFADAMAIWKPLAAQGDPRAELGIGVLYDLGDGVTQDTAAALDWYRKSAEEGLPDAELNVAVMYDSGRGTARDAAAAARWYACAAAHHDHRAEYDLAQLYATGDGVPRNPQAADAWLRAAAAGGLDAAGERLSASKGAAPEQDGKSLAAVTPQAPADGGTVQRLSTVRDVELVWTAPPQPVSVRFFVEVVADAGSGPVPVLSGYTDRTSMLVPLQPSHGQYLWRVYVVGSALRTYVPTGWQRFSVVWRGEIGAG